MALRLKAHTAEAAMLFLREKRDREESQTPTHSHTVHYQYIRGFNVKKKKGLSVAGSHTKPHFRTIKHTEKS